MDFQGYCFRCRAKQAIQGGTVTKTANGRVLAQGICPKCGTPVNRFLSDKQAKE